MAIDRTNWKLVTKGADNADYQPASRVEFEREDTSATRRQHIDSATAATPVGEAVDLTVFSTVRSIVVYNPHATEDLAVGYTPLGGAASAAHCLAGLFIVLNSVDPTASFSLTGNAAIEAEILIEGT
jgi:hypothetical protein